MKTYTLVDPDGREHKIDGPEGATKEQVYQALQGKWQERANAIDIEGDEYETRRAIESIPFEDIQRGAYDRWAQSRAAKDRSIGPAPVTNILPGASRIRGAGNWLANQAAYAFRPGEETPDWDEVTAMDRARRAEQHKRYPIMSGINEALGTIIAPGAARGAGPVVNFFTKSGGPLGQALKWGGYGAAEGALISGEASNYDADEMRRGAALGGTLGGIGGFAAPLLAKGAGALASTPAAQRLAQPIRNISDRIKGTYQGATGTQAAAEQVIANTMARQGVDVSDVARRFGDNQTPGSVAYNARMGSGSDIPVPYAMIHEPGMTELAGTMYRRGGQARGDIADFFGQQQFGPRTGRAAQHQRLHEGAERALQVRSKDAAPVTLRKISRAQQQRGNTQYDQAMKGADDFSVAQPMQTLEQTWDTLEDSMRNKLERYFRQIAGKKQKDGTRVGGIDAMKTPRQKLERANNIKKGIDDAIEKSVRAGTGHLTRELTKLKNALLDAVHQGGKNKMYSDARAAWGLDAREMEIVEAGRNAFRTDSDELDAFLRELGNDDRAWDLYRRGMADAFKREADAMKRGSDLTARLDTNRAVEAINRSIKNTPGAGKVFGDRAERFAGYLADEARMKRAMNEIMAGSPTAERHLQDAQNISQMMEVANSLRTQGPIQIIMNGIGSLLNRMTGINDDVAREIARILVNTDPVGRAQTLQNIAARYPQQWDGFVAGVQAMLRTVIDAERAVSDETGREMAIQ